MTILKKFTTCSLVLLLLSSCATTEEDPHENFNRDMLDLNVGIDKNLLRPAASGYRSVTSDGVRTSVTNFFDNFKEPYYLVNYMFSFQPREAMSSLFRFLINSTVGILGFFDVAERMGFSKHSTDYKDSLHYIGVSPGNYLMLPILGSNSTNYVVGEPISWFVDPMSYVIGFPYMTVKAVLSAVNTRADSSSVVDDIIDGPMDEYSVGKSLYYQRYSKKAPQAESEEFPEDDEFIDGFEG